MKRLAGIKDIRMGRRAPSHSTDVDYFNFSHLLSKKLRAKMVGLETEVRDLATYVQVRAYLTGPGGKSIGALNAYLKRSDNVLVVEEAHVDEGWQNLGLGKALYEAVYRTGYQLGARAVRGGNHSTMAHRVHASLASKHLWNYDALPNREEYGGDWSDDDWFNEPQKGGARDDRWASYRYALSGVSETVWGFGTAHLYMQGYAPKPVRIGLAMRDGGKRASVFVEGFRGSWGAVTLHGPMQLKKTGATLQLNADELRKAFVHARPAQLGTWESARAESKLLVTDAQLRLARTNKAVAVIWMKPSDFLKLTTTHEDTRWNESITGRPVKELDVYNRFTESGEIHVMPFLQVDLATGRVEGHEGRHRAAAVMNAGGARMPVAIILREGRRAVYYREQTVSPWTKTFLTHRDIPRVLQPEQFYQTGNSGWTMNRTEPVVVDFTDARDVWAGYEQQLGAVRTYRPLPTDAEN